MDFATRFKQLRLDKGWTQDDIATKLNSSRSTIAGYESPSKYRIPDTDKLVEIAELFNVSIDYLLGRTNIREAPEKIIADALQDDPELLEFWSEMKKREDLQLLFKQVKPMTPEGVKKVIRVIKAMEEETQEG